MSKPVIWTVDDDPDVLRAVERDLRRHYGDRYKVISAVAGNDVLRDEGLAYGRKLDVASVDVTVVNYENLIHDYGLLNAISQVPAVRDALHQTAEMLRKHLLTESAPKGVNK